MYASRVLKKKQINGSKPRQESHVLILHVLYPIYKSLDLSTDIRDHRMEKEETECQVTNDWHEDKLALSLAGSRSACFSGYTSGVQWRGEHIPGIRRNRKLINKPLLLQLQTAKMSCHLNVGQLYINLTSNHHNSVQATGTCLVQDTSVCCILHPQYQTQSSATLRSAKYAILCAEASPKLPLCYNQTLSQSKSVPAMPTCHCQPKPKEQLLGGHHMRTLTPKLDLHHMNKNIITQLLQGNLQFHY